MLIFDIVLEIQGKNYKGSIFRQLGHRFWRNLVF